MQKIYFGTQIFTWPCYILPHLSGKKRHLLEKRLFPPKISVPKPVIWIHTLSVGEVQASLPLLKALKKNYPGYFLVFTVATAQGLEQARLKAEEYADLIWPGPIDLYPVITRYVKGFNPRAFILVESDVWPGVLSLLKKKGVPLIFANAAISKKSFEKFKKYSFLRKFFFGNFDVIGAATLGDFERFKKLLPTKKIFFPGNLKFEIELPPTDKIEKIISQLSPFLKRPVIVCGSTHPGEEEILFEAFRLFGQGSLVIAPRKTERAQEVLLLAQKKGFDVALRSKPSHAQVMVVDTLGELLALYALADIAFVGGTLVPVGGHNIFEPVLHSIPVSFGPYVESISDLASLMIEEGVGFCASDAPALVALWQQMLARNDTLSSRVSNFCKKFSGISEKYLEILATFL